MSIKFSDRVLTHTRCVTCAAPGANETIFQVAERFDETLAKCPVCLERSVEIGLRDEFALTELVERYAGRPLPGKFIVCTVKGLQVFVELEGA